MTNAQSIVNKIDELNSSISAITKINKPIDIIVITESWLRQDVSNTMASIANYSIVRNDRISRKGGGVAMYLRSGISYELMPTEDKPQEIELVILYITSLKSIICAVYLPPNILIPTQVCVSDYLISCLDKVSTQFKCNNIILCGDFNTFKCDLIINQFDLYNVINFSTCKGGSMLDKIFVSEHLRKDYKPAVAGPPLGSSYHYTIILEPTQVKRIIFEYVTLLDMRESHVDKFCHQLSQIDFTDLFAENNIDRKCDFFYKSVHQCLSAFPEHTIVMTNLDKPWMTPVIKLLINKRWSAFRNNHTDKYNFYKHKIREAIVTAKLNWSKRQCSKGHGMWKVVKLHTKGTNGNALDGIFNNYVNKVDALNEINNTFGKAFKTSNDKTASKCSSTTYEINQHWIPQIDVLDVYQMLINLNTSKATGSDGICNKLYKIAAPFIAEPLKDILNKSLQLCKVPLLLKTADVCAAPKVSNPSLQQLRPLSLLCVPNQILESYILKFMKSEITAHIDKHQFAYVQGGSATCALLKVQATIAQIMDACDTKGCILIKFDFSKAFDCVDHKKLLAKLTNYGFLEEFILWTQSYLTHRTQRVRHNNDVSDYISCTSGVPQGSKIGPLLFALYTADIKPFFNTTTCTKFSDDTTSIVPVFKNMSNDDVKSVVAIEMKNLSTFATELGLKLNNDKTEILTIYKKSFDRPIFENHSCDTLKLLGIYFNCNNDWSFNFNMKLKICSSRVFALKILKDILPRKELIDVYRCVVLSIIEYANPVFLGAPLYVQQGIEKLQRRCHNIIDGINCNCKDFQNLSERRLNQSMKLFNNIIKRKEHILCDILPHRLSSGRFNIPYCNTSLKQNVFAFMCALIHNQNFIR